MRFNHSHAAGVQPGSRQRRPVHRNLRFQRRHRDRCGTTVLIRGRPSDDCQDAVAIPLGISQPFEQHHGATLGPHKAVRSGVERATTSRWREHPLCRRRCAAPWFEQQGTAPGQGEIAFAGGQTSTGQVHRRETGRASGVDGRGRPLQAKCVGDTSRCHAVGTAGEPICSTQSADLAGNEHVIGTAHADENPGRRTVQRRGRYSGMLHRLPCRLQQHAVLGIDRGGLPLADAEEVGIETGHVVEEAAPLRHRAARHARLGDRKNPRGPSGLRESR